MLANKRILISTTALVLAVGICASSCFAQVRRYQPSRPTMSPYLGLSRVRTGPLPNYYALVRPDQQQRAVNLQQQALINQQAGSLQRLQNSMQPVAATGKRSGFLQPSSRSTFSNSSRYFQTNTGQRGW